AVAGHRFQPAWSSAPPVRSAAEHQALQARHDDMEKRLKTPSAGQPAHVAREANPGPAVSPPSSPPHTAPGCPRANTDLDVELNSTIASGGICPSCLQDPVLEPSVAANGKYLFETGNWYAAVSSNSGASWTYNDPVNLTGEPGFC